MVLLLYLPFGFGVKEQLIDQCGARPISWANRVPFRGFADRRAPFIDGNSASVAQE